ncbi:hypothetical protein D3C80_1132560 [compost metagenome]
MLDATGGAGARHEGQVDAQITGAVAHGGRGQGALARLAAGHGGNGLGVGLGRGRRLGDRRRRGLLGLGDGRSRSRSRRSGGDIALALDLEADQRPADGDLMARIAVQGDDHAVDRAGDLDRGLVGHDVGEDLILLDRIADLDVPADQLGLGGAFAHVRQLEDIIRSGGGADRRGGSRGCFHLRRLDGDGGGFGFGDRRRLGVGRIARALDLELDQGAAHRHHLAGLAVDGQNLAADRGGDLDGGLVGHDVGDDLVFLDHVADRDVPGDQFGLGGAFAHVGQLEDETTHINGLPT